MLAEEFRAELQEQGVVVPVPETGEAPSFGGEARAQLGISNGHLHPRITGNANALGTSGGLHYTAAITNINPGGFQRPFHLSPAGPEPAPLLPSRVLNSHNMLQYGPDALYLRGVSRLAAWQTFAGWRVELGRDWLQWGPEYSGGMLYSDNAGPLDMLRVSKFFNLGRLGTVGFEQFEALDPEPSGNRYLLGRRLSKSLGSGWDAAVEEGLAVRGGFPVDALILPYYLSQLVTHQREGGTISDRENYNINFQLGRSTLNGSRYYGDIYIDEIKFPIHFSGQQPGNRSAGFLAGASWMRPTPSVDKLTVEAVYTDATRANNNLEPYLNSATELDWARYGQVIGNPIGGGSSGILGRADFVPGGGRRLFLQGSLEQHNRLAPKPDVEAAMWIGGTQSLGNGRSVNLTLRPYRVFNAGNVGGKDESHFDAQAYVSMRF